MCIQAINLQGYRVCTHKYDGAMNEKGKMAI